MKTTKLTKGKKSKHQAEVEYPNQSEKGKCELRITSTQPFEIYCEPSGCRGECVLYSVPQGKPKAEPHIEKPRIKPDPKKYYFCRCVEL
jgi:hypothetical protein